MDNGYYRMDGNGLNFVIRKSIDGQGVIV